MAAPGDVWGIGGGVGGANGSLRTEPPRSGPGWARPLPMNAPVKATNAAAPRIRRFMSAPPLVIESDGVIANQGGEVQSQSGARLAPVRRTGRAGTRQEFSQI